MRRVEEEAHRLKEDIRRRLLDQRVGGSGADDIGGRLRAEANDAVLLADCLELVLDEEGEDLVVEKPPALIKEDHHRIAAEQFLGAVKDVHQRGRSDDWVVEHPGHVEAEDR